MTSGLLLDTHAVLWLLSDDPKLSRRARGLIRSGSKPLNVSLASVWEIVLKHQAGKLRLDMALGDLLAYIFNSGAWSVLPIVNAHIAALSVLPLLHRDPFDRLLIAQAQVERLAILTADSEIREYAVETLW